MNNKCHIVSRWYKFLAFFFLMLFVSLLSFSQKYSTKLYDERFGCFQKNISEILRDKNGFLWLGTESGLVRFDGSNFNEFFPKENKYKNLGYRKIKKFNDDIYLNYEKNGVLVFDLKKYQYKKVFNEPVIEVEPISENTFIVLTESGFLKKIINGETVKQLRINAIKGSLMAIFRGTLYVSLPQIGIMSIDTAKLTLLKKNSFIIPDGYRESFDVGENNLAFVSKSEVKIVAGDLINLASIKNALIGANPNDNISYYKYITPLSQFFIIQNKYICNVSPSGIGKLYFKNIVNCELLCIFSIDSNSFFVGSGQGLIEVRNNEFQNTVLDDNIPLWGNALRVRRSILEKIDGSLVLMGYPRNINYENNCFEKIGDTISSPNQAILVDNYIYAGYDNLGFVKIDSKSGRTETLAYSIKKQSYFGIYHDTINHFIIAGGNGFLAIHNLQKHTTKVLSIFKERIGIRAIIYDPISDNYWLGTANGLYVCDRNFKITKHFSAKQNNANGDFYSALLMPKVSKEIWAAHNEGVSIFDAQTQKLIKNLPMNLFLKRKTVSLIEDNAHRIWMGTYQGIIGFDPKTSRYIRLTTKNNLINSEFNYASATKLANGNLIFGGLNAYDIINPDNYKFDTTLIKPIVSGYQLYSKNDTTFYTYQGNELNINIENQFVKIFLATTNLIGTNKATLEYSLDNGPWLSTYDIKQISLFNLNPGTHLLHVRSFDEYGAVSEMKPLIINAYVSFYKSNLFLWTLIFLVLIGFALYLFASYRSKLMQKITKENIAMDLHDEVGTMLTRALYLLKIESKESKVVSYMNDALYSLRVYINTMNKNHFQSIQLTDELNELCNSIIGANSNINISNNYNVIIAADLFRDIKLSVYEVLNNIQKHAHSNHIVFQFSTNENVIKITIVDDGVYVSNQQIDGIGNGIHNIKKRVARNKGIVKFEQNMPATGLKVTFQFPINK